MSVCKGGVGSSTKKPAAGSRDGGGSANKNTASAAASASEGKENASSGNRLHMFSDPSPTKAKGGGAKAGGRDGSGSGGHKEEAKSDATAFDLMPPPLPRTPGKGKAAPISRSAVLSPLGRHDPNLQQPSAAGGDGNNGNTVGRGRSTEKVGGRASVSWLEWEFYALVQQYWW